MPFWETCTGNISHNDILRPTRVYIILLSVKVPQPDCDFEHRVILRDLWTQYLWKLYIVTDRSANNTLVGQSSATRVRFRGVGFPKYCLDLGRHERNPTMGNSKYEALACKKFILWRPPKTMKVYMYIYQIP